MPARDFDRIYTEHSRMVYWTAFSILKSQADAMDVSQNTFLRVLKHSKKVEAMDDSYLRAWLYRITVNLALDLKRREKRVTPVDEFFDSPSTDKAEMPEQSAISSDISRCVHEAVDALPEIYRVTVTLHFFAGLNYAQIAELENVSEGTIKSRMSRAKEKLATLLTDGDYSDD